VLPRRVASGCETCNDLNDGDIVDSVALCSGVSVDSIMLCAGVPGGGKEIAKATTVCEGDSSIARRLEC
jgi:hypothetical protein